MFPTITMKRNDQPGPLVWSGVAFLGQEPDREEPGARIQESEDGGSARSRGLEESRLGMSLYNLLYSYQGASGRTRRQQAAPANYP